MKLPHLDLTTILVIADVVITGWFVWVWWRSTRREKLIAEGRRILNKPDDVGRERRLSPRHEIGGRKDAIRGSRWLQ